MPEKLAAEMTNLLMEKLPASEAQSSAVRYYFIETPAGDFTFIGGQLQFDNDPNFVWLSSPPGKRLIRLPRQCVRESSIEETAARLVADAKAAVGRLSRN